MINAFLKGIIGLIVSLVSVILAPIDSLITSALPDLASALNAISGFLNVIQTGIAWAVSATGLSPLALQVIVMYFVFKLTAPMLFYMIKLALAWYNRLKP